MQSSARPVDESGALAKLKRQQITERTPAMPGQQQHPRLSAFGQ